MRVFSPVFIQHVMGEYYCCGLCLCCFCVVACIVFILFRGNIINIYYAIYYLVYFLLGVCFILQLIIEFVKSVTQMDCLFSPNVCFPCKKYLQIFFWNYLYYHIRKKLQFPFSYFTLYPDSI